MAEAGYVHWDWPGPTGCAVHGHAFMLAGPPGPELVWRDRRAWWRTYTPRTLWRQHWVCMACCLLSGAAPIRAVEVCADCGRPIDGCGPADCQCGRFDCGSC